MFCDSYLPTSIPSGKTMVLSWAYASNTGCYFEWRGPRTESGLGAIHRYGSCQISLLNLSFKIANSTGAIVSAPGRMDPSDILPEADGLCLPRLACSRRGFGRVFDGLNRLKGLLGHRKDRVSLPHRVAHQHGLQISQVHVHICVYCLDSGRKRGRGGGGTG